MPNGNEPLNMLALQQVQSSLCSTLTSLMRDPEQLSIQYETDKLTYDWRQYEAACVSAQRNQQFVAQVYAQMESETAPKEPDPKVKSEYVPFNTKA